MSSAFDLAILNAELAALAPRDNVPALSLCAARPLTSLSKIALMPVRYRHVNLGLGIFALTYRAPQANDVIKRKREVGVTEV